MKFFLFNQSNPGGAYLEDMPLQIIIQANNAEQANKIAQDNGVYFDGIQIGMDCECCNDRWYRASKWDGYETLDCAGRIKDINSSKIKIIYNSSLMKELS